MISAVHVFEKLNSLNEFYNLFWQFKVVETIVMLKLNILQKKLSQLFIRDRTVELLDSL